MDAAEIARLEHERLHWQQEAERLNVIVHAQRARIRTFEGSPDRLLLQQIRTYLQSAWVNDVEKMVEGMLLAEKLGVMLDV